MIHAYNEYYLDIVQNKLASMFELAVYEEKLTVDEFGEKFIHSYISKAFGEGDPIYILGKSANELLGLVLNKEIEEVEQNMLASPEYWVGWILAYVQWYISGTFLEIITYYPCSKLLLNYFPYHEMDKSETVNSIVKYLPKGTMLKILRNKRRLSQVELSKISNVSLRSIKAYEQGKLDISKAQGDTLYKLSKTLDCSIENLIKKFPLI